MTAFAPIFTLLPIVILPKQSGTRRDVDVIADHRYTEPVAGAGDADGDVLRDAAVITEHAHSRKS